MTGADGPATGQTRVPARQPVTIPSDDRSPAAIAYQWATRIMVVSLEMVLPGLAGYWVDRWLGSLVLFTMLGFAAGSSLAVLHLIRMTRADEVRRSNR
ncbi:MAG: AtpZ/AtpI family protein [Pirellulales bacterium]